MASDVTNSVWHYQQMYSKLGKNGAKRHLTQDNPYYPAQFQAEYHLDFRQKWYVITWYVRRYLISWSGHGSCWTVSFGCQKARDALLAQGRHPFG
jgi:hypothetical protein